ncbi:MAG: putative rane protein, partial [Ilumatobacteraceae bacterium]|nr:putative rane protein [Ilumatobacteraceae bacterium]
FFTNLGMFTVRRRRLVLYLTVLLLLVAGAIGSGAFGKLKGSGYSDPGAESTKASDVLHTQFRTGDPNLVILVDAKSGSVDDPAVVRAAADLTAQLAAHPDITQVVSYWSLGDSPQLRSRDGSKAVIVARMTGTDDNINTTFDDIDDQLRATDGATIKVQLGGGAAVSADLNAQIGDDLAKAETLSVPITLVLLILVFGGLIAAGMPLLIALISVVGTLFSLFVIGSLTDVSIYSINLTTALGLGLANDYSLFIVNRYREELARGLTPHDAVVRTVETAGRTVAFSSFVVAASLSALLVFPLFFLRSFAYAGISVVIVAAIGATVALPALLAVVGRRVNSLSVHRRTPKVRANGTFWHRLAHGVMRRPVPVALGTIALLLVLGTPFLKVNFGLSTTSALPKSAESRQVSEQLTDDFATNSGESFAIVAAAAPSADITAIDAYAAEVSALSGVAQVDTLTGTYRAGALDAAPTDRNAAFASGAAGVYFSVTPSVVQRSAAGEALVKTIRHLDAPFSTGVEGSAAQLIDTKAAITSRLPIALGLIALITFVLLFLVFGSVLVPIKAIVLNLLSLTATFGAMVWIFQQGHGSGLLDFTADGTLDVSMPILMFCIAFGLSMDYEVFLLSRIKEDYDRTGDNTHAVATGLEQTGRIVTAAAALLAVTFLAFGISGVTFIKMFGLGLALAVVMDATIIRGLLVPAFMRLAGDANWWAPAWMRRIHNRFGISEGGHSPAVDPSDGEPTGGRELVDAGR